MNRKRIILAILLGVLVVCFAYAYIATPRLEKAPPRSAAVKVRSVKGAATAKSENSQERIDFGFLFSEPQPFDGAKRDIFNFVRQRPVRTEPPVAVIKPVQVAVVPAPVVVPFAVVQKSLSQFTFLGFLEKAGKKTVFLSSGGKVFLVKRGERFGVKQEFLVSDIKDNLLQVRHSGRDQLIEIKLIEQQKLNASVSAPARREASPVMSSQPGKRVVTPNRRNIQPASPPLSEEFLPELIEENNPEVEQDAETPAAGDVLEGEVNGTNQ